MSSRSGIAAFAGTDLSTTTGFFGSSRNNSSDFIVRGSGVNGTIVASSTSPLNKNVHVFQRNSDDTKLVTDARFSFYSIGESLDLAALDSRVSRLMVELAFTINTSLVATPYDIDTLLYINSGYDAGGTLA